MGGISEIGSVMGLKTIPSIISPDLLHALSSMGHGDMIVLADAHFPAASICKQGPKEIRADGHEILPLLKAVLRLLPLDYRYCKESVVVMDLVEVDRNSGLTVPIWPSYLKAVQDSEKSDQVELAKIERYDFYDKAKKAFAVVATGDTAQYANIILQKGLVTFEA